MLNHLRGRLSSSANVVKMSHSTGCASNPGMSKLLVVMWESTLQAGGVARERGVPSAAEVESLWGWVESHLFTNSHEHKYLAFRIFQLMLPSLKCASSLAWPHVIFLPCGLSSKF